MFPSTYVHHISGSLSNHCPLWICTDDENIRFHRKIRPFRFEALWMMDEWWEGVIKNSREGQSMTNLMERVVNKIKMCNLSLQMWSKQSFGNVCCLLQQKKELLVQVEKVHEWIKSWLSETLESSSSIWWLRKGAYGNSDQRWSGWKQVI